jgi:diguanylate cyclase (GGDEF)-like protein/PAS domain S-box-containing protein
LKFITDNTPALIAYVGVDQRYTFVNQAYRDWFGVPLEKIVGQSLAEFYGAGYHSVEGYVATVLSGSRVAFERKVKTAVGSKALQVTMVPDYADDRTVQGFHILATDVSEIKDAQLRASASEERLRTITDNLPALVCYIDRSHTFRFNNKTYERWQKKPLSEITDHRVEDVYGSTVYRDLAPSINRALEGHKERFEVTFTSLDGSLHYARGSYIPDFDADGAVRGIYGLINNVTTLKRAEEKLLRLAQFDALTGLPNRNHFNERLQDALDAAEARNRQLAVLFLDLDKFKFINDSWGHLVGDAVLTEFGTRLKHAVRPTDIVARLGGDEFVVIIPEILSSDEPLFVARKIINVLAQPILVDGHAHTISSSIGVALKRPGEVQVSSLLKRADEALYAAKHAGRNTFKMIA